MHASEPSRSSPSFGMHLIFLFLQQSHTGAFELLPADPELAVAAAAEVLAVGAGGIAATAATNCP